MSDSYMMLATWLMHNYPKVWREWNKNFKGLKTMKQHDDEHKADEILNMLHGMKKSVHKDIEDLNDVRD